MAAQALPTAVPGDACETKLSRKATGAFGTGRLTAKFPRFTPLHRA
jgi:hypothetical protein